MIVELTVEPIMKMIMILIAELAVELIVELKMNVRDLFLSEEAPLSLRSAPWLRPKQKGFPFRIF